MTPRLLLHVFPSFGKGGVPIRISRILNHLGPRFRHVIVATDGNFACASHLSEALDVRLLPLEIRKDRPLRNLFRFRSVIRSVRPDLMLTYNWGSIEWALANRLAPVARHIHFESGFGVEEADHQLRRRVLMRRFALARAEAIVVPSYTLVDLARGAWGFRADRVVHIPNGIDVSRFRVAREPGVIPGFAPRPGEVVIGTIAPMRPEKNLGRLVRAFAEIAREIPARLVLVGEGTERSGLEALASRTNCPGAVLFPGHIDGPERLLGCFDIFAISSDTEQMPNSLLEAMAAGLPVAATDVGDVRRMLSPENGPFVIPREEDARYVGALRALARDRELRDRVGRRNRERVEEVYPIERMFAMHEELLSR